MRAEKPCITPLPELQMEPDGPSYGPKPFWASGLQNLVQPGARGGRWGTVGTRGIFGTWVFSPLPGSSAAVKVGATFKNLQEK